MRVTMHRDQKGSEDGLTLNDYKQGETYNMSDELGGVFLREGWGELEREPVAGLEPKETKPAKGPKETK